MNSHLLPLLSLFLATASASFAAPSPVPATGPKQIIFNKVNGLWYVQN